VPRPIQSVLAVGGGGVLGLATATLGEQLGRAASALIGPTAAVGVTSVASLWSWLAWLAGFFAGGWAAARLAPTARTHHALAAGAVLGARGLADLVATAQPTWLWLVGLAAWLSAAWAGAWWARPRPA
jgi:hypothetical protein